MKTQTAVELIVGRKYQLGTYQSCGDRQIVTVTAIEPDKKGWYNDHQGGGWMSNGVVVYTYDDNPTAGDGCGNGWDACEYAEDNWTEVLS